MSLVGRLALVVLAVLPALVAVPARAQSRRPATRPAVLEWNPLRTELRMSLAFRDVVDEAIRKKLTRGLPTTIVLTGTVYRSGTDKPLSTTVQTCRITWLVWDEVYRVEVTRPDLTEIVKTITVNGVLRRCAETTELLVGVRGAIPLGVPLTVKVRVLVNPVSPEMLQRIKLWVSRPTSTGTAAPADALFSTFTGLFLQRLGEAERKLEFSTRAMLPRVKKKPRLPPPDKP